jgi:hypothetical protein
MRVRRTVPQFTFSLSKGFVNAISSVSTGFFRFLPVLFGFRYIFPQLSPKTPLPSAVFVAVVLALVSAVARPFVLSFRIVLPFPNCFVIPEGNLRLPLPVLPLRKNKTKRNQPFV